MQPSEPIPLRETRRRGRLARVIVERPGLVLGMLILGLIVLAAIFAPYLTPYDPYDQDIMSRRLPPVWNGWFLGDPQATMAHPFGTDNVGRDYWARLVYGARISLIVGFVSVAISGFIGSVVGISAGYFGGKVDLAANFLIQTRLAVPVILVALAAVAAFGGSLQMIILIAGLLLWDRAAVVTRTVTQQIAKRDFIKAAKALGASDLRIILTEILPNLAAPLAVILTVEMGQVILLEASLSFLGLGIPPPAPSWGLMLAEAKEDIFFAPWAIAIPGAALFLLVLSTSLVGDGLQKSRER
ncbi:ABC transporter permease [Microvirga antarctica]|uniref:ABC transporter permease n=1 Tax=Microvirga antarctica TaxID=2819233 RepID=UPI001FE6CDDD|nr:ABC transporter permease [Microvirga antarctica]